MIDPGTQDAMAMIGCSIRNELDVQARQFSRSQLVERYMHAVGWNPKISLIVSAVNFNPSKSRHMDSIGSILRWQLFDSTNLVLIDVCEVVWNSMCITTNSCGIYDKP
jgi:nitrate reductase beta subunit